MKFVMESGVLVEQQLPSIDIGKSISNAMNDAADGVIQWLGTDGIPLIADGFVVATLFFILLGIMGFKSGFNKAFKCGIISLLLTVIGRMLLGG